jgi:hypothetical protein
MRDEATIMGGIRNTFLSSRDSAGVKGMRDEATKRNTVWVEYGTPSFFLSSRDRDK